MKREAVLLNYTAVLVQLVYKETLDTHLPSHSPKIIFLFACYGAII
jgi:hypothetical protein